MEPRRRGGNRADRETETAQDVLVRFRYSVSLNSHMRFAISNRGFGNRDNRGNRDR